MADPKDPKENKAHDTKDSTWQLPAPAEAPPKEIEAPKDTVVVSGDNLKVEPVVPSVVETKLTEPEKKAEPVVPANASPKNGKAKAERKKAAVDGLKEAVKEVAKTSDAPPATPPPAVAVAAASAPPVIKPPPVIVEKQGDVLKERVGSKWPVLLIIILLMVLAYVWGHSKGKDSVAKTEPAPASPVADVNPSTVTPPPLTPKDDEWKAMKQNVEDLKSQVKSLTAVSDSIVVQRDQAKDETAAALRANAEAASRLEKVNQVSQAFRHQKEELDKESLELLKD